MGRASKLEDAEHLTDALSTQTSHETPSHGKNRILVMFNLPVGGDDLQTAAAYMIKAMPSNRESAVVTCFPRSGRPAVFRWDAGKPCTRFLVLRSVPGSLHQCC